MSRQTARVPSVPVVVDEYQDLLDELHTWYLHVNCTLEFDRLSKNYVEMSWVVECDGPLSLITVAAFSHRRRVTGNKPYNVMQTLYDLLYAVLDVVLADVAETTKIQLFPV